MIKRLLILITAALACILALGPTTARAEETSYQTLSIIDNLKAIPGIKQGVAYSALDNKFNYMATIEVFQKSIFSLEVGYAGDADATDYKLVGVISTSLLNLKQLGMNVPILDLLDFRLGIYAGVGGINVGDSPSMRGNNEFDWGASLTAITLKF